MSENLKAKAKTLAEIAVERKKWQDAFRNGAMGNQQAYAYARDTRFQYEQTSKWVLLSDAEAEIQQLQKRLDEQIRLGNVLVGRNIDLKEQVEAAKITLFDEKGLTEKLRQICYDYPKMMPNCDYNAHSIDVCLYMQKNPDNKFAKCLNCRVGKFLVEVLSQRKSEASQNSGETTK